mgnify:CR=1 FL=1
MRDFLDIPLVVRPLIDTSLHKLAIETDPVWCLRIRQRGGWKMLTTPRVSIFAEGTKRQFGLSFILPRRAVYTDMYQVMADLERTGFVIRSRVLRIGAKTVPDELAVLRKMNDDRSARLSGRRKLSNYFVTNDSTPEIYDHPA